jgi:hypothetical protein
MPRPAAAAVAAVAAAAALAPAAASRSVSHVHLGSVSDPTVMNVQWTSGPGDILGNGTSTVEWGPSPRDLQFTASGFNWTYVDAPNGNRTYTFNLATMTGLTPGATYFYRVGDPLDGWGAVNSFVATRDPASFTPDAPLRIALFGDLGWYYAQALPYLQTEAASGAMDLFVHVGDFAYDLNEENGTVGDQFQDAIEPITSSAPYLGCIGNHEGARRPPTRRPPAAPTRRAVPRCVSDVVDASRRGSGGRMRSGPGADRQPSPPPPTPTPTPHPNPTPPPFPPAGYYDLQRHYLHRFRVFVGNTSNGGLTPDVPSVAPGLPNNLYYSINVGPLHLVAMSTELYFDPGAAAPQYAWLDADLAAVNRTETPWVIVYGHRSIYCSCDSDCDGDATAVRDGPWGMEALLNKYRVDVFFNGHEHDYERNYPTYNFSRATAPSGGAPGGNSSAPEVIVDAAAPVYIVSGCAGDKEHHEPFTRPQPEYSAFRSNTYGYGRLTIYNATALLWEARQTDSEFPETTGTVIDAMLLLKTAAP